MSEFAKLANLREAISIEQKHLQDLYQINDTANTLSVLLQTQAEQKELFKLEMEQVKQAFEDGMTIEKSHWHEQHIQLELDYKEQKNTLEKTRKREEEEYIYILELNRRKEIDEYNNKKATTEKELSELKNNLLKQTILVTQIKSGRCMSIIETKNLTKKFDDFLAAFLGSILDIVKIDIKSDHEELD